MNDEKKIIDLSDIYKNEYEIINDAIYKTEEVYLEIIKIPFKHRNMTSLEVRAGIVFSYDSEKNTMEEMYSLPDDGKTRYSGRLNYAFWGPKGSPYNSHHPQDSIAYAIIDALSAIRNFDDKKFPNEVVFWVNEKGIFDSNGRKINSYAEAEMIRDKYNAKRKKK